MFDFRVERRVYGLGGWSPEDRNFFDSWHDRDEQPPDVLACTTFSQNVAQQIDGLAIEGMIDLEGFGEARADRTSGGGTDCR